MNSYVKTFDLLRINFLIHFIKDWKM